jgi:predicted transcriptional regulator of viral defense system
MKQQDDLKRNIQDYQLLALGERKSMGKEWVLLSSNEIMESLGLDSQQSFRLLSRLLKQKRIQQLRRGLYLVPGYLPPGKIWAPSNYEALWAYMDWLGAKWQITGHAAFTRYGFSTQIPQIITVYNNKLSGKADAGGGRFIFIKLPVNQIGSIKLFKMPGGIKIPFSSKARTIFDAIHFANRFGTIPEAYKWIKLIAKDSKEIDELIKCTLLYGNKQSISRIGFVLESINIDVSSLFNKIEEQAGKTFFSLIPNSRNGPANKKWKIIENKNLNQIFSEMEIPDDDETTS